jgi:cell division septation protein DedD
MPSREPELYKDKVEVSLDGRQIFYLFFGGAMIVGIVFVLGVLVGRRVEARGHIDRAHTTSATDPLAALDRLEGTSGGLAFRGTLTGKDSPTSVEKTIDQLEKARTKPEAKTEAKTEAKAEAKAEAKPAVGPVVKPEGEASKAEPESKKPEAKKVDAPAESRPVTKPDTGTAAPKAAAKEGEPTVEAKAEAKPAAKPEAKPEAKIEEPRQRFTLQLSSFQDRTEAEAFLDTVKAQGYQAQITQAEVEGKGTFYRVRMGSYRSLDAATSAKSDFEKASSTSASIMRL